MRTIEEIRSNTKPIILLGSSLTSYNLLESCEAQGITVLGFIDPDYMGQTHLYGKPLLDKDTYLTKYKDLVEFFVATNWNPDPHRVTVRNNNKRDMLISWIDEYNLTAATLVHPTAIVSPGALIGRNVSIGALTMVCYDAEIHDDASIKEQCYISHGVKIGRNTVIQLRGCVTGDVHIGSNTYIGVGATLLHRGATATPTIIGDNVLVHPNVLVFQDLPSGSTASLRDKKFSRVF
jgi:UDP-3-O-[3-hydroxymyristoyl] glucosamine N-acyltransferase